MRAIILLLLLATAACGSKKNEPDADVAEDADLPDADDVDSSTCTPGRTTCDGQAVTECSEDGESRVVETCDESEGELCRGGTCIDACEVAATEKSYVGCEYWPTITPNPSLADSFDFAVVIGNPNEVAAAVSVTRNGQEYARASVPPGSVATVFLPWIAELKGASSSFGIDVPSAIVRGGAYRMTSVLPVYAYQFSPLDYAATGENGQEFSYTNDASLLLPSSTLGREYLGLSRSSFGGMPGFLAIVGTVDATEVTFTSSARTGAAPGVPAMEPGDTRTFQIDAGDVVLVTGALDNATDHTDLTGSRVVSTEPVALFGGHACTYIPDGFPACDHLEEQVLPLETWGKSVVAVSTIPLSPDEPNFFRVVSGTDDNEISFQGMEHEPVTLDAGEFIEVEHHGGLRASGTGRVAIVQYMVGQVYVGRLNGVGDPSMGQGIPEEQLRTDYVFLVPATYTRNWVTVFGPMDAVIAIDGLPVGELAEIGDTGFGYAHVIASPGGHRVVSEGQRFGITLYGVASFTSYLYPGGLDLKPIPLI